MLCSVHSKWSPANLDNIDESYKYSIWFKNPQGLHKVQYCFHKVNISYTIYLIEIPCMGPNQIFKKENDKVKIKGMVILDGRR